MSAGCSSRVTGCRIPRALIVGLALQAHLPRLLQSRSGNRDPPCPSRLVICRDLNRKSRGDEVHREHRGKRLGPDSRIIAWCDGSASSRVQGKLRQHVICQVDCMQRSAYDSARAVIPRVDNIYILSFEMLFRTFVIRPHSMPLFQRLAMPATRKYYVFRATHVQYYYQLQPPKTGGV
jgi:hypothetical protein